MIKGSFGKNFGVRVVPFTVVLVVMVNGSFRVSDKSVVGVFGVMEVPSKSVVRPEVSCRMLE